VTAADVTFVRYPVVNRYRTLDEAVADCKPLFGDGWVKYADTKQGLLLVTWG